MKKVLVAVFLGVLLSSNAYAKRYYVTYSNYFGQASGTSYGTKSFKNSKDEALLKCKNLSEEETLTQKDVCYITFKSTVYLIHYSTQKLKRLFGMKKYASLKKL